MKTIKYLFISILIGLFIFSCKENKELKTNITPVEDTLRNVPKIKLVFVLSNPNIDLNKMNIDEVINEILVDSIIQVSQVNPEFSTKTQIIKVYRVEDITCPYLKKRFDGNKKGELVFEYNGKVLIKLNDGVIKVFKEEKNHPKFIK